MFNIFKKQKPVYGEGIFIQRSWIDKKTEEAAHDKYTQQACVLGEAKEQKKKEKWNTY